jgi:hypothetical protein
MIFGDHFNHLSGTKSNNDNKEKIENNRILKRRYETITTTTPILPTQSRTIETKKEIPIVSKFKRRKKDNNNNLLRQSKNNNNEDEEEIDLNKRSEYSFQDSQEEIINEEMNSNETNIKKLENNEVESLIMNSSINNEEMEDNVSDCLFTINTKSK